MQGTIDISPKERDQIRVEFYRAHRSQDGFSSVAVRRDHAQGHWFLDVGATGPVNVPSGYRGLPVRVARVAGAVNAVAPLEQLI